jgi:hypothetical protein
MGGNDRKAADGDLELQRSFCALRCRAFESDLGPYAGHAGSDGGLGGSES